ncbi:MAG: glutamine-hydrolyzing GMP synthase [Bdellovibrionaceae bacterium]|nr:glutamine-hydrolyzing GMP synthase [Pseudobdellovibrionaceae bacterium]NUM57712.1 glutamine-hydrolyzing GMP synthase [Pseudobdellovibrionaceae bacterium]
MTKVLDNGFLILDFGSQVTQLIARRLREMGFYSEIKHFSTPIEQIQQKKYAGIILSGGPSSVYEAGAPYSSVKELQKVAPLMGICYGMQLICHDLGGKVESAKNREYGYKTVLWKKDIFSSSTSSLQTISNVLTPLSKDFPFGQNVWMSHGDVVTEIPSGFELLAITEDHPAAIENERVFAVQFHPEVVHTEAGEKVLEYFVKKCGAKKNWETKNMLEELNQQVLQQVRSSDHVLCGLSGGVDSSVVAVMLTRLLGKDRVHCVFVNNGLLRKNEYVEVLKSYENLGLNVLGVDASDKFLQGLKTLIDPELKRKAIGRIFIEVFEEAVASIKSQTHTEIQWLAQGTLYPDVIESVSTTGSSVTIKSHHNVGGLPERLNFKLLEPVRLLFKDEVRNLGRELGAPDAIIKRHPFPGPGLSIRVIGEVTESRLKVLREADYEFISYLKEKNLYDQIWQAFCVLTPIQTVGVMGDGRTYEYVLAVRAVTAKDGMTADWYEFKASELKEISTRLTNRVKGISRVVYDITSKPPATIEWE